METTRDQREDHTKTRDQIENQRGDHTTTRVLPTTEVITESEGPKETDSNESKLPAEDIYMLAGKAIIEADIQISELVSPAYEALFYPGTTTNEIIGSLYKIKSILDTIQRESRRLYDGKRDKN